MTLVLEELKTDGNVVLGRLEDGEVVIGREPSEGIAINNGAISRNHGVFARIRSHWFYKDLGSTNGSWHNGARLNGEQWRLVRPGDIIQVADTAIRLSFPQSQLNETMVGLAGIGGRSLLVFSKGDFVNEFAVPEYGRALVVGGAKADLSLEGDVTELPSLVVERRGDNVCAFRLAKDSMVSVNNRDIGDVTNLADGDEVRVGDYVVLMNDPTGASRREGSVDRLVASKEPLVSGGGRVDDRSWSGGEEERMGALRGKSTVRIAFGQSLRDEDEGTVSEMGTSSVEEHGYDRHPSMRFSFEPRAGGGWRGLEDRVIVLVGFFLLLALMILVVLWVLL